MSSELPPSDPLSVYAEFTYLQIGEHRVQVPLAPKKAVTIPSAFGGETVIPLDDLVIGRRKKRDDAYWERPELPLIFYKYNPDPEGGTRLFEDETVWEGGRLVSLDERDSRELVYLFDREMYRREHGVHFKNGDELVWLTGDHYFALTHGKMYGYDADYGRYFEYQRDFAYVVVHARRDPNILGVFCAKPKKTGITQFMALIYLNKATMKRMKMMGMMSKGNDAADVNMVYFLHAFDGLPLIFKPTIKNRADKEGEIIYGEPPVRNSRTKKGQARLMQLQDAAPLNTRVWAAKTKEAGFDSPLMADIWFDELPKYDTENKQDVEQVFIRNQETVKIQSKINGKIWVTSYPPERDTRGFMQARKIYYDSKLSTIKNNPLGRTASGLICHYISALNSHIEAFDKWGKCDMRKAKLLNEAERNAVKHDKKLYQAKIRQYSETEKECWSSSGAGSTFDNIRLGEVQFTLDEELRAHRPWVEGRLEWANSLWEAGAKDRRPMREFCEVRFIPLTEEELERGEEGRLRIYLMPGKLERCAPLRTGRDQKGNLLPLAQWRNYGGTDPTEYAKGSEVNQGSKNASWTMNFRDPALDAAYGRIASGILVSEYFFRPDNPEEFYQDLVKEIIFFGKIVIVEANKKWVATRLIQDGLGHYMLVKQRSTGLIVPWTVELEKREDYTLIQTTDEDHENIVRAIARYIMPPSEGETDYFALGFKSERGIQQLMDFDPTRWKFFDQVMALGWTLICGEVLSVVKPDPNEGLYAPEAIQTVWAALNSW